MKALIKKEAIELAIPFACLLVLVCALWFGTYRVPDVLWGPRGDPIIAVLCAGGLGGFLLALFQFYVERVNRTHGYLVHRGSRAIDVFASKAIVGLVATYALAGVPPLVFAAWQAAYSPFAATIQWERVAELAWIGTFGVCGYAAGAACVQLRRHFLGEICFGVAAGLAFAFFAHAAAVHTAESSPAIRYVIVQLVIAAGALTVAYRLFARPVDRDLPLPRGLGAIVGASGIVLFVGPVFAGYALAQDGMRQSLQRKRAVVMRDLATGRFFTVRGRGDGRYVEIDAHGEPVARGSVVAWDAYWARSTTHERIALAGTSTPMPARKTDGARTRSFNGAWTPIDFGVTGATFFRAADGRFDLSGYFDPHEGVVRLFFEPRPPWSHEIPVPGFSLRSDRPFAVTLRRPDARERFSPSTVDVGAPRTEMQAKNVCLFDPSDGTLWEIDPFDRAAPVRELALPEGERALDVAIVRAARAEGGSAPLDVVVGERGSYAWNGAELAPLDTTELARAEDERDYRVAVTDADPIAPQFEIRDAKSDALLFSLDARPRGISAWATVASLHVASFARSPLFNTVSFLSASDAQGSIELLGDRMFFGQRRLATLLAGIAIAVVTARGASQRLRARYASRLTVRAWTIAIVLLGLPAHWLFVILEPRASKSSKRVASEEPRTSMLICDESSPAPSGAQGLA